MWRAVCGLLFVCIVLQAQATDQTSTKPAQKKDKDDDEKPKPQKSELSKMFDSFGQGISEGVTKLGAEGKRALDKFQVFLQEKSIPVLLNSSTSLCNFTRMSIPVLCSRGSRARGRCRAWPAPVPAAPFFSGV
eukprot:c10674_g1_i1.p1 GENE.c10674_g1_i1~~c10674_g1_i1.p1  ORF type:complete len:133 (+),score=6.89 c10674_g1_i1:22-420(+)